jgi:hypothetical protein
MFNALMNAHDDTPHASPLHTTLPYSEGLIQVPNIHASRGESITRPQAWALSNFIECLIDSCDTGWSVSVTIIHDRDHGSDVMVTWPWLSNVGSSYFHYLTFRNRASYI